MVETNVLLLPEQAQWQWFKYPVVCFGRDQEV